jgi:hypothetical protein
MKDGKGRTGYVRDADGNVVKSRQERTIAPAGRRSDRRRFLSSRLRGAKTIDTLYEKGLAPLPKSEQSMKLIKRYHERYHWPLAAAIVLLLMEMLLPERRAVSRRSGKTKTRRAVPGAPATVPSPDPSAHHRKALHHRARCAITNRANTTTLKEYQLALQRRAMTRACISTPGRRLIARPIMRGAIQHFTSVLAARDGDSGLF